MRSLHLRIFLAFWLIIVLSIVTAASLGFLYAERARSSLQSFEVSDAMIDASEALRGRGRAGLVTWLESLPFAAESVIYIVDEQGRELIDRQLPGPVRMTLRRSMMQAAPRQQRPPRQREPDSLRPARPYAELVGPAGEVYTLIVLPPQTAVARWLSERGGLGLAIIALLVSAGVSYLLARVISKPISRFRESTAAIAAGDLDTRMASGIEKRSDEIGELAKDFNHMTRELQLAWQRQAELTSNVSHELRSPLARLKVALELARRKTGELAELDRIDVETERLDEIIGQLLTFSKLDADPHERAESVDLVELLAGVIDDVQFEHIQNAVDIDLRCDSDISINGYPLALRSAFENLLRNAASHGGGQIQVRVLSEGEQAIVEVQDRGEGVPEAELERLFEPFYRTSNSAETQGAGLGLAIAARAIAIHDGSIDARNTDEGLCIAVRLPSQSNTEETT
jgi:two-component system OmpR family sensor kinase